MSALKIFRIVSKAKEAIKNRCNILHKHLPHTPLSLSLPVSLRLLH